MARAKVVLTGEALSYSRGGRTFRKGQPQYLTATGEIEFYRRCASFSVVDMSEPKAKAKAPKADEKKTGTKTKAKKKTGKKKTGKTKADEKTEADEKKAGEK